MRKTAHLLLLILCFALTGCFELIEQVTLKKDGSGTFSWIANLSQSKDNINGLLAQDSILNKPVPRVSAIKSKMARAKGILGSMPGISGVETEMDFNNYLFKVTCQFADVASLDEAIAATLERLSERNRKLPRNNFVYREGLFSRKVSYAYEEDLQSFTAQAKEVLTKASFTAIYRFDDIVKSSENPKAKVSPSGKATMLKVNLWEALKERQFENSIHF